ncbi:MAG TPA: metal-sensing transcriptional repressor [Telluria sp.]|nr:metal-sensing transcriptional repressor [Telluria sp.]
MSQLGKAPLTPAQKTDVQHRLARIEGQLRNLRELVATAIEPADCDLAVHQLAAACKALEHCATQLACATLVTQAENARDLDEARQTARRLADVFEKYLD